MSEVFYEGRLASGSEFSVYGRAENGTAERIDQEISRVGQDAIIVLPEYNLAGVFDGAGGTTDVGSPEKAALTAAEAVRTYLKHQDGADLSQAMEYARQAVINDPAAGICVGGLVRLHGRKVEIVNAGDIGIVAYDRRQQTLEVPGQQQIAGGRPANYLGRQAAGLPDRVEDQAARYDIKPHDELYIMSDGALGNWQANTALEDYHFAAAQHDYGLLMAAKQALPGLEYQIRSQLTPEKVQKLKQAQLDNYGSYSAELDNPSLFSIDRLDWSLWQELVRPYIEASLKLQPQIDTKDRCSSLVDRPISWSFERPRPDDASIVRIEGPSV